MAEMTPAAAVSEMVLEAQITRCTCGHPDQHPATPCPEGRVERAQVLSYWSRSPFKRLRHYLRKHKEMQHG
jgi:hypothetical protein